MRLRITLLCCGLSAFLGATGLARATPPPALAWAPAEGANLLGTAAPEWQGLRWLQGGPLTLAGLRGHPVLVRFWTDGCSLCARSAPALEDLWRRYRERGLVVVGIHHPKSQASRDPAAVQRAAHALGMTFPMATDREWETLRRYGVGTTFTAYTSVSFLIDKSGIIRFVHDVGELHPGGGAGNQAGAAAFTALEATLRQLLGAATGPDGR